MCVSLYKEMIIIIIKSQKEETIRGMIIRVTTSSDRLQTASETNQEYDSKGQLVFDFVTVFDVFNVGT